MKIEIGTILIAKTQLNSCLIIDKEYSIIVLGDNYIYIKSELYEVHSFLISTLHDYFDIKETPKFERYLVVINNINTEFNNYDTALEQAKKLCIYRKSDSIIYKAITKVELNDVKITDL